MYKRGCITAEYKRQEGMKLGMYSILPLFLVNTSCMIETEDYGEGNLQLSGNENDEIGNTDNKSENRENYGLKSPTQVRLSLYLWDRK